MQLPSYPKVYAIGHSAIHELFLDPVVVQEKLDGSQFSFGVMDGKLYARSRGNSLGCGGNVEGMFKKAWDTAEALFNSKLLEDGLVIRCEAFDKPKHNTLAYARVPLANIAIFDIEVLGSDYQSIGKFLPPREVEAMVVQKWHLEVVPTFDIGMVNNKEKLLHLLELDSFLGGCKIEGVVVKNYKRFTVDGKVMMGKYVSEAFKEKHGKDWKLRNPSGRDKIGQLIDRLRTEARWQKSIQHLKEEGLIAGEPRDIGLIIGEIKRDLVQEEGDWLRQQLFKEFIDDVVRGVLKGFPEWYKQQLLDGAFKDDKNT